jgi:hypothetical protein
VQVGHTTFWLEHVGSTNLGTNDWDEFLWRLTGRNKDLTHNCEGE